MKSRAALANRVGSTEKSKVLKSIKALKVGDRVVKAGSEENLPSKNSGPSSPLFKEYQSKCALIVSEWAINELG